MPCTDGRAAEADAVAALYNILEVPGTQLTAQLSAPTAAFPWLDQVGVDFSPCAGCLNSS